MSTIHSSAHRRRPHTPSTGHHVTVPAGWRLTIGLVLAIVLAAPVCPDEDAGVLERIAIGLLVHDRGPISDRQEDGLDLNFELQLRPPEWRLWKFIGNPKPHAGLSINSQGGTNIGYGGVTYDFEFSRRWLASLGLGFAVHDGDLHQSDETRCTELDDCGFGSRVLFRISSELAFRVSPERAISIYYDHVSHKEVLADENEGIDNIGVRYLIEF